MEERINELWLDYLCNKMSIGIIKQFDGMYNTAYKRDEKYKQKASDEGKEYKSTVIEIFKYYLDKIHQLDSKTIEQLYKSIKNESEIPETFDDLVRATIKSLIIVLSDKKIKQVDEKYYNINIIKFVHKCCIECGKLIYNHPTLFYHNFDKKEMKDNKNRIIHIVKCGIRDVLIDILPLKDILSEYLKNNAFDKKSSIHEQEQEYHMEPKQTEKPKKKEFSNVESLLIPTKINQIDEGLPNYFDDK
jgi:hypothetical protein